MQTESLSLNQKKILSYSLVYTFSPICIWLLFKLNMHPLVSWMGTLVSLLGILFSLYHLIKLNIQMNRISDIPHQLRPQYTFKIPLLLSCIVLIVNIATGSYFIQHNYFPSSENRVSISIINQSSEPINDIYLKYGNTERIIKEVRPNERQEVVFTRQNDTSVSIKVLADEVERTAQFSLDDNQTYSSVRIDPLKNILPNF